jgi:hypothetical protein
LQFAGFDKSKANFCCNRDAFLREFFAFDHPMKGEEDGQGRRRTRF